MRTFNLFVVELKKTINDTITTSSGLELFIDNRFNEFENRVTEGPVVAVPFKYNTGVKVGDTLYFHHLVVINDGQPLTGEDNNYLVRYDPDNAVNNQAIAYKCQETGEVYPMEGWSILHGLERDEEKKQGIIEVVELQKKPVTKGVVAYNGPGLEALGLKVGDVVGFKENRDYRLKIDGRECYRVRTEDLLYVEA